MLKSIHSVFHYNPDKLQRMVGPMVISFGVAAKNGISRNCHVVESLN